MADVGQRSIEVYEVLANVVHAARQSLSAGESTLDDCFVQVVCVFELVAVLLVAWLAAGEIATGRILAVVRYYTVESEA